MIIINCAEIANKDWTFLKDRINSENILWYFHSSSPSSWLERIISRPNIARFRSCFLTALQAKYVRADFIVSHLPRTTMWVSIFSKLLGVRARHLAYSFNFTDLPSGKMKKLMTYAFKSVERFVVYSTAEKKLYSEYFDIPKEKIDIIKWSMDVPEVANREQVVKGDYVCAVGGEGRDYGLLLKVAERLKEIKFIIVARPNSIDANTLPSNVILYKNVSVDVYWNIVAYSKFVVLPLKTATTNCGHITIVGSQLLGKPIVSTISSGTSDYLVAGYNSLLSMASNVEDMKDNVNLLWSDESLRNKLRDFILLKNEEYDLKIWVTYFNNCINSPKS